MTKLLAQGGGALSEEAEGGTLDDFDDLDADDLDTELGEDVTLEDDEAA